MKKAYIDKDGLISYEINVHMDRWVMEQQVDIN